MICLTVRRVGTSGSNRATCPREPSTRRVLPGPTRWAIACAATTSSRSPSWRCAWQAGKICHAGQHSEYRLSGRSLVTDFASRSSGVMSVCVCLLRFTLRAGAEVSDGEWDIRGGSGHGRGCHGRPALPAQRARTAIRPIFSRGCPSPCTPEIDAPQPPLPTPRPAILRQPLPLTHPHIRSRLRVRRRPTRTSRRSSTTSALFPSSSRSSISTGWTRE